MGTVMLLYCTDVRDGYNNTPLVSACMGGNKELVQYLVEEIMSLLVVTYTTCIDNHDSGYLGMAVQLYV